MTHGRYLHPLAVGAWVLVALSVASACGASPTPMPSSSSPQSPLQSLPVPVVAGPSPTATPISSASSSSQPTGPSQPLAGSYPLVISCNPASVPGSVAVATPTGVKPGPFTLHVPILMYHRIVPYAQAGDSIGGLIVPPRTFSAQLSGLAAAGWHTITMATLADDLQAHRAVPARTFVITLDDGWDDGYTSALPALQSHGFVATFYVIAGRIDLQGFLTSAHLRALVAAGDEIGDHTMDHDRLAARRGASLAYQIDAAAARIAQVTGYWPETLAYPYGSVNGTAAAAVGACQVLRMAALEGPLEMTIPAPAPTAGATAAPPVTKYLEAYETWSVRFEVPRLRVTADTTAAELLAEFG
jgi:peptidoglycan/xylan/chitin deacetylase (PgdA/CDA1 family)